MARWPPLRLQNGGFGVFWGFKSVKGESHSELFLVRISRHLLTQKESLLGWLERLKHGGKMDSSWCVIEYRLVGH